MTEAFPETSRELTIAAPKTGPWIIGYVVSLGLSFAATMSGAVTDVRIGALFWIPIAICTGMMIWTSWRRHRLLGAVSEAVRAFWWRFVIAAAFMFASYCLLAAAQAAGWGPVAERMIALLPFAGFLGMVWAVHQYAADERDEYLRSRAVRQMLIASFVALSAAALWDALFTADLVGQTWTSLVVLFWLGGLGIGRLYNETRP